MYFIELGVNSLYQSAQSRMRKCGCRRVYVSGRSWEGHADAGVAGAR